MDIRIEITEGTEMAGRILDHMIDGMSEMILIIIEGDLDNGRDLRMVIAITVSTVRMMYSGLGELVMHVILLLT